MINNAQISSNNAFIYNPVFQPDNRTAQNLNSGDRSYIFRQFQIPQPNISNNNFLQQRTFDTNSAGIEINLNPTVNSNSNQNIPITHLTLNNNVTANNNVIQNLNDNQNASQFSLNATQLINSPSIYNSMQNLITSCFQTVLKSFNQTEVIQNHNLVQAVNMPFQEFSSFKENITEEKTFPKVDPLVAIDIIIELIKQLQQSGVMGFDECIKMFVRLLISTKRKYDDKLLMTNNLCLSSSLENFVTLSKEHTCGPKDHTCTTNSFKNVQNLSNERLFDSDTESELNYYLPILKQFVPETNSSNSNNANIKPPLITNHSKTIESETLRTESNSSNNLVIKNNHFFNQEITNQLSSNIFTKKQNNQFSKNLEKQFGLKNLKIVLERVNLKSLSYNKNNNILLKKKNIKENKKFQSTIQNKLYYTKYVSQKKQKHNYIKLISKAIKYQNSKYLKDSNKLTTKMLLNKNILPTNKDLTNSTSKILQISNDNRKYADTNIVEITNAKNCIKTDMAEINIDLFSSTQVEGTILPNLNELSNSKFHIMSISRATENIECLAMHLLVQLDKTYIQCSFCPKLDKDINQVMDHILMVHSDLTFSLKALESMDVVDSMIMVCRHCDFATINQIILSIHFEIYHSISGSIFSSPKINFTMSKVLVPALFETNIKVSKLKCYLCNDCYLISVDAKEMAHHILARHSSSENFNHSFVKMFLINVILDTETLISEYISSEKHISDSVNAFYCILCETIVLCPLDALSHYLDKHASKKILLCCNFNRCHFSTLNESNIRNHLTIKHKVNTIYCSCTMIELAAEGKCFECVPSFNRKKTRKK